LEVLRVGVLDLLGGEYALERKQTIFRVLETGRDIVAFIQ
jgi:hypothetical protein